MQTGVYRLSLAFRVDPENLAADPGGAKHNILQMSGGHAFVSEPRPRRRAAAPIVSVSRKVAFTLRMHSSFNNRITHSTFQAARLRSENIPSLTMPLSLLLTLSPLLLLPSVAHYPILHSILQFRSDAWVGG